MSKKNISSYFIRLASYSSLLYKPLDEVVSFITLASHGYSYLGHDLDIQCEGCKKTVMISGDWSDINIKLKHLKGCFFETCIHGEVNESIVLEPIHLEVDGICDARSTADRGVDSLIKVEESHMHYQAEPIVTPSFNELPATNFLEDSLESNDDEFDIDSFSSSSLTQLHKENQLNCQRERHWSSSSSSLTSQSSGYCSDISADFADEQNQPNCPTLSDFKPADSSEFYDFSDLFIPENCELDTSKDKNNLVSRECEKNPGHYTYFALNLLKMEQLPSKFRCDEIYRLLRLMGELTVRIVVSSTSIQQKKRDHRRTNQYKKRVGTGFVIEHPCQLKTLSESHESRKFNSLKNMFPFWRNNNIWNVYIQTSRQLVFDEEDAHSAIVEFYYDSSERRDVVTLEGKHLLTSKTQGDSQCLLVCECFDTGFIHKINHTQQEFYRMAEKLPSRAKRGMLSKLFSVHHPHGGHKILSYGDYVRVRYKFYLAEKSNSKATLTKLANQEQVDSDVNEYRKTMFYAADTCPGSCGAPLLTFSQRPTHAESTALKVDISMHNGVEITHHLGASTLKLFTDADLIQPSPELMDDPEEDSDENSLGKQQVSSPVYKVNLASSGFYYTGVADCVQCFHCSLKLRSWKAGDDVITQHEKYRPECPYLMLLTTEQESVIAGAVAEVLDSSDQSTEELNRSKSRPIVMCNVIKANKFADNNKIIINTNVTGSSNLI
ncbi:hypothetical protein Btru_024580 [Bulinus truncatus]|nr:hypothetical protein Btru_024580 [Bulinus truncatus]